MIKIELALVENGLCKDIEQAKTLLSCGLVFVGDKQANIRTKLNEQDIGEGKLRIQYSKPYVSRGAIKLETVFEEYHIDIKGFNCLDIGASTGGFTQLLLRKGVNFVYAIDVGRGIIDNSLRMDERVMVIEGVNARLFSEYDVIKNNISYSSMDMAVFDLSFISLKKVIPNVLPYLKKGAYVVPLVKPQFESRKGSLNNKGVLDDPIIMGEVLNDMEDFFIKSELEILCILPSKIKGPSGNQEYFYVMVKKS